MPGDLVRIVVQPESHDRRGVSVVGEVGFLERVDGPWAYFVGIHPDGRRSGSGTLPIRCLERESTPSWVRAKELHDERQAKSREASDAHQVWHAEKMAELSAKHGLSVEKLDEVYSDVWQVREGCKS